MNLSPEQSTAARRTGQDACCVAGPGSGKTRVLVARYIWLIEQGYDPESVLAITFTEKATRELKGRLAEAFAGDLQRRRAVERSSVYTIDGFCHSLLRTYALRAGLDPEFEILDEREAQLEAYAAIEAVLDRFAVNRRNEFLSLLDTWACDASRLPSYFLPVYEKMRASGGVMRSLATPPVSQPDVSPEIRALLEDLEASVSASQPRTPAQKNRIASIRAWLAVCAGSDPEQWLESYKPDLRGLSASDPLYEAIQRLRVRADSILTSLLWVRNKPQRNLLEEILAEFEAEFRRRKRRIPGLDFGDLVELARDFLTADREARDTVRQRYRAILMDELQDTSPLQWELVDLIRGEKNFFAVGDINQSIYGFRGADPGIFDGFRSSIQEQGVVDELFRNYRSRERLLEVVNRITPGCPGLREHTLTHAPGKDGPDGPCVELVRMESGEDSADALWIAERISQLAGSGQYRYAQIAVLARKTSSFEPVEAAFSRAGIPYVVRRGRNFFDEPEIVDLSQWLRVLNNPQDEIALTGLLRSPFFGVTDEEIYSRRTRSSLEPPELVERLRLFRGEIPVDRLLARALDETGYLQRLSPAARANTAKFLDIMRQLQHREPEGYDHWIESLTELRAAAREPNAPAAGGSEAVEILTVHTAKGLEWPVVFLTAMDKSARGFEELLLWGPEQGLGSLWQATNGKKPDRAYQSLLQFKEEQESLEEHRLLYVGMTRAEELLVMTWEGDPSSNTWAGIIESRLQPNWPEAGSETVEGPLRLIRAPAPASLDRAPAGAREMPPESLNALPIPVQPPPTVSVTALAHLETCPRKHLLSSHLRWPAAPQAGGTGGAMALGSEVHEILGGLRVVPDAAPEAAALAAVFARSELGKRASKARRLEREFDFLVEFDGLLVHGVIDLWFQDDAGVILVDYKTDSVWDAQREAEYSTQLRLYAAALGRLTGSLPKEAYLYLLRQERAQPVQLCDDISATLREYRARYGEGRFETKPGPHCAWCAYAGGACPEPRRSGLLW